MTRLPELWRYIFWGRPQRSFYGVVLIFAAFGLIVALGWRFSREEILKQDKYWVKSVEDFIVADYSTGRPTLPAYVRKNFAEKPLKLVLKENEQLSRFDDNFEKLVEDKLMQLPWVDHIRQFEYVTGPDSKIIVDVAFTKPLAIVDGSRDQFKAFITQLQSFDVYKERYAKLRRYDSDETNKKARRYVLDEKGVFQGDGFPNQVDVDYNPNLFKGLLTIYGCFETPSMVDVSTSDYKITNSDGFKETKDLIDYLRGDKVNFLKKYNVTSVYRMEKKDKDGKDERFFFLVTKDNLIIPWGSFKAVIFPEKLKDYDKDGQEKYQKAFQKKVLEDVEKLLLFGEEVILKPKNDQNGARLLNYHRTREDEDAFANPKKKK